MNMIPKVSCVFCDTESAGLNIGKVEEVGIRIYMGNIAKGTTDPRIEFILPK